MKRSTVGPKPIALALGPKGGMPRGKPPEGSEDETMDYGSEEESGEPHAEAFSILADAMGIAPEKRASAQAALKTFVRSCMSEYGSEE